MCSGEKRSGALSAPVAEAERIQTLDVLRGFALIGVLTMNMQAFAMPFCAYMNPTSFGDQSAFSFFLWSFNHVLFDQKLMTIFSMLFGAGIVLMAGSAEARTGRSAALHYRRMFWLLLFGAAHGLLIWVGDILFVYALCGLIAYLLRRLRPWLLITIGILLLLIPFLIFFNFTSLMEDSKPEEMQELFEMWAPDQTHLENELTAYRGGYLDNLAVRSKAWAGMMSFIMLFGWRILGVFLLGMALFRTGVLSGERSRRFYVSLMAIGFPIGLALAAYGIHYHAAGDWEILRSMGVGSLFNYSGSLLVAFGWIGAIMLLCRSGRLPGLQRRLGAVGRMAFTNYIMQSVILTTIFYGFGFGLYGHVGRLGQLGLIVAVAALQLWYSPLWLARFRFGPLEWLWRALTYWRLPAFRRDSGSAASV